MKIKKKTFLITGANGFLASNIIKTLVKQECLIYAVINKSLKNLDKSNNIKVIQQNLALPITKKFPKKVDYVLHFASSPNDRHSVSNFKHLMLENTLIDINFFNFCKKIKFKKFLYASSSSVYDDKKLLKKNVCKEAKISPPYNPDELYGFSKLMSEKYLDTLNFNFIICRIFSIYGDHSKTIINYWNDLIEKDKNIEIWGNPKTNRSWLHINDFVDAILKVLLSNHDYKYFNIASDENLKLIEIFKKMKKFHKNTKSKVLFKNKEAGPINRFAKRKNLNTLNFKQKIYLVDWLKFIN